MNKKVVFISDNNPDLFSEIVKEMRLSGIWEQCQALKVSMFGVHTYESIIKIFPTDEIYVNLQPDEAKDFVKSVLINGKPYKKGVEKVVEDKNCCIGGLSLLYHKQLRLVLRNCGKVNPESIESYLDNQGYKALATVLKDYSADGIIEELKVAGLRGRGGAGFPTYIKWQNTRRIDADQKYIVCNADEGDPGAYMDRSVLESDPHSVLEGMAIAAYCIGATKGFVYARAEYPLAISRLNKAIDDAKNAGLLGENILGTDFSLDLEVRLGAGAFVCGEETALITSIEGNRGMPRPRPPYPSVKGLWGKPTVINNVETLANIPLVFLKGGGWYSKIGTEHSKGTKVFALTGKVKHSGLVEVPMGTYIEDIVYDVGGGILNDLEVKAVQTGGPSGGMIPKQFFKTPISYESLVELGSMMGSGGMIVMDKTDCIVDVTKFYLQFSVDESCGKCSPCRIGGKQMLGLVEKIANGTADDRTIGQLRSVAQAMQLGSLCGLGQSTPNPVISALRYFEHEILQHINEKTCRMAKCKDLVRYTIVKETCIGCHLCAMRCPADAIIGERKKEHLIEQEKCIKCGECYAACKFDAIEVS